MYVCTGMTMLLYERLCKGLLRESWGSLDHTTLTSTLYTHIIYTRATRQDQIHCLTYIYFFFFIYMFVCLQCLGWHQKSAYRNWGCRLGICRRGHYKELWGPAPYVSIALWFFFSFFIFSFFYVVDFFFFSQTRVLLLLLLLLLLWRFLMSSLFLMFFSLPSRSISNIFVHGLIHSTHLSLFFLLSIFLTYLRFWT